MALLFKVSFHGTRLFFTQKIFHVTVRQSSLHIANRESFFFHVSLKLLICLQILRLKPNFLVEKLRNNYPIDSVIKQLVPMSK
jgi:hypothetical protein